MHIVIDARIRRASTGRPVDRLLTYIQSIDKKNRYTVLLEPDDDWKPKSARFVTVPCRFKQFSFNPLQQILYTRQLYKLKPDLVHFTLTGQQPVFYFGTQITFTHDLTMLKYARRGRLPRWLHWLRMRGYRFLLWQAHRKAKKILVPTAYVRDTVAKYHLFSSRKIVISSEAAEPPLDLREQPPATPPENFLLYVGTAFPHKNLRRFIKSFELLKPNYPQLKLVLVGKNEQYYRRLKRWAKSQPFYEDLVFTGFVPDRELKWFYTHAQAYVFPSLSEGFGLPGLEAMAHGCPVISSDATCLPEVYGEAALYFDPYDVDDMAAKIGKALRQDGLRKKLIQEGHKQVRKYSWQRMAEQTLEVYSSVLEK